MNEEQNDNNPDSEAAEALQMRAQALPQSLAPASALWQRIEQDLPNQVPAPPTQVQPTASKLWTIAAGLVLTLGAVLLLTLSNPEVDNLGSDPNYASAEPELESDPYVLAVQLQPVRRRLLTLLDTEFADMPPTVRATVLHNLEVIAAARQDIERALGLHPNDPLLRRLLIANYGNEMNLLKNIETLTRQQQRRIQL